MNSNQSIRSFDSTFSVSGELARPDRYRSLYQAFSEGPCVSRGQGVSLPLLSAGEGLRSVESLEFNRILAFDVERAEITVESGITIGALLKFLVSQELWLPVLPGHPSITVGGCFAVNVHGKSQYHSGLFSQHVSRISLFHPRHGVQEYPQSTDLFQLSAGGFGLTGHILNLTLKCQKLKGRSILKKSQACKNIWEAAEALVSLKDDGDQIYSWNNLNRRGSAFGRGFIYLEKFQASEKKNGHSFRKLKAVERSALTNKIFPAFLRNRVATVYGLKEMLSPRQQSLGLLDGAFPINGKEIYYALFGRTGLLEAQIIVPIKNLEGFFKKLARAIENSGVALSLGSLKVFRGQQKYLNFDGEGICVALDAANSLESLKLFMAIDELTIEFSGIPNISKDSRLSAEVVRATFGQYADFRSKLRAYDPEQRIDSALRKRLAL